MEFEENPRNKRKYSDDEIDEIPTTPQNIKISKFKREIRKNKCKKVEVDHHVENDHWDDLLSEINFDDFIDNEKENVSLINKAIVAEEGLFPSNANCTEAELTQLDLTTWKRCIVESSEKDIKTWNLILSLREDGGISKTKCQLQGAWCSTEVNENDIVSIRAIWDECKHYFVISNESGFIVTSPDYLISGTSVVGSLFCRRKGVLSNRFTGIDCNSKIMTMGSLIHELIQIVLKRNLTTLKQVQTLSDELLNSQQTIFALYASQMSAGDARTEIQKFLPNIVRFVRQYITGDDNTNIDKDSFDGKIDSIYDIEENIWVPQLGLKGKVDVSVKVRSRNNFFKANIKPKPIEIKTGKASFSSEHRGQVILYQMMMTEVCEPVDSGLLLYLKEGIMKEVLITRNEQRDLILLRNNLAYYLTRNTQAKDAMDNLNLYTEKLKSFGIPDLPEPINHHSACGNCPYNVLCCTFLSRDKSIKLSEKHPIKTVLEQVSLHLSPSHVDYFIHWTGLLALEELEVLKTNQIHSMWTDLPQKRQKEGRCLIDLEITGRVICENEEYVHTFSPKFRNQVQCTQNKTGCDDLTLCGINIGEYLRVSTNNRIAIAAGRVVDITKTTITINLERNLNDRYKSKCFILDKNDSNSFTTFNLANLAALLNDQESSNRLRNIIIDRNPPTFSNKLPKIIAVAGKLVLAKLNTIQQKSVLRALTVNEYLLLKGLPGTGKTQTLVAIVVLFAMMGKSVLITSHTNSAVDNVLLRLLDKKLKFIRLGSSSNISPRLSEYTESILTKNCKTPDDLDKVYDEYNIVGVTCLGAAHPLLVHRTFDVCLVDESTQVLQSSVIRPLLSARKFILVGDPEQLSPIIRSREARLLGADESLFTRLDCEQATSVLTMQYRMNKTITTLANKLTYKGSLKCANDSVALATMKLPKQEIINKLYITEKWLIRTILSHVDQSVILLNTGNIFNRSIDFEDSQKVDPVVMAELNNSVDAQEINKKTRIYTNYCEAAIVLCIVNALMQGGIKGSSIGIIAPYRAQVELLKQIIKKNEETLADINVLGVEVNTVDQYQGRDKEIIIYSCTKCDNPTNTTKSTNKDGEILEDQRRLTVAITRSKHKLIMIGDVHSLQVYSPFKSLFQSLSGMFKLNLMEGQLGFAWDSVLQRLAKVMEMGIAIEGKTKSTIKV